MRSNETTGAEDPDRRQLEKPAPTTVTALEDKGVPDPEGAINDLVEQVGGRREGSRYRRAATQANTPASEPTRPSSRP